MNCLQNCEISTVCVYAPNSTCQTLEIIFRLLDMCMCAKSAGSMLEGHGGGRLGLGMAVQKERPPLGGEGLEEWCFMPMGNRLLWD